MLRLGYHWLLRLGHMVLHRLMVLDHGWLSLRCRICWLVSRLVCVEALLNHGAGD